jgi:hypothetical protein
MPKVDRKERHQRIAVACRSYLRRSRGRHHDVLEVAVQRGDAGHEGVRCVERPQREGSKLHYVHRVVIRVVCVVKPSAVDPVGLAGPEMAIAVLNYDATAIHVVGQVVAKGNAIQELIIAEWYHDVVLL